MKTGIIGVTTTSYKNIGVQAKTNSPSFKANYSSALCEGKSLINRNTTFPGFKKILAFIKNKFSHSKDIPQVEKALLVYFTGLQTKKEFLDEFTKKSLTGEYIDSNIKQTASIIKQLDSSKITKSWEFPDYKVMFNDGTLTNSAYSEIRKKIIDTDYYKLNDYAKRDLLNNLARSSYHTEDVSYDLSFRGDLDSVGTEAENSISDITEDSDSSFLDAILDFLDDLF